MYVVTDGTRRDTRPTLAKARLLAISWSKYNINVVVRITKNGKSVEQYKKGIIQIG